MVSFFRARPAVRLRQPVLGGAGLRLEVQPGTHDQARARVLGVQAEQNFERVS